MTMILLSLFIAKNLKNIRLKSIKKKELIFLISKMIKKGRRKHQRKVRIKRNSLMMKNRLKLQNTNKKTLRLNKKNKNSLPKNNNIKNSIKKGRRVKTKSITGTMAKMMQYNK
jgi:hypothetical protein